MKYILILVLIIIILTTFSGNFGQRLPNIILITIDALRPDHLGCYGYNKDTSPNIDKLAEESIVFTQAISQGSKTLPTLPSIMTSTYPHTHKVYESHHKMNSKLTTLVEYLSNKRYKTYWITNYGWFPFDEEIGFGKEFDIYTSFPDKLAKEITHQVISWISKAGNDPFFIWVHYLDTHAPYEPPSPYNEFFSKEDYRAEKILLPVQDKPLPPYKREGMIPGYAKLNHSNDVRYYLSQYDGAIKYVDAQIGELLGFLKIKNLREDTVIIITSDHGEGLGEHNFYFDHGVFLYDELIRVPLIISYPYFSKVRKVIDTQIELIDIAPTILDILGLRKPFTFEGISLLPLMLNREKSSFKKYAFSDIGRLKCVRTKEWKLIYDINRQRYELYNLVQDPEELNNLYEAQRKELKQLKAKLEEFMTKVSSNGAESRKLDKNAKERLRSLGYIE